MVRLVEPTKVCANPECHRAGQRQPWSNFYSRTYWEDGSTRNVVARCKPCHNAARVLSYRRNPGSKAAACQRWREKVRQDPSTFAEYQEKQRFYNASWRMRHGARVGLRTKSSNESALPCGPFADWLRHVKAREGLSRAQMADRLGTSERTLNAVLDGERQTVRLQTVETALIGDDGPVTLRELYPDLYLEAA